MSSVVVSLVHSLRFLVESRVSLYVENHRASTPARRRESIPPPMCSLYGGGPEALVWLSRSWRSGRLARCATGRSRPNPRDVDHESAVGCASNSRGAPEIGIAVSQATMAKYMRRHPRPTSQTWRTFLTNQANQIMAANFFVVTSVTATRTKHGYLRVQFVRIKSRRGAKKAILAVASSMRRGSARGSC